MLVIRAEQMRKMAAARRLEVARKIERELHDARPELFAGIDDAKSAERIRLAIDAAVQNEITGSRALRLYVELSLQYAFEGDGVLQRILSNKIEPPLVRVRRARVWLESRPRP